MWGGSKGVKEQRCSKKSFSQKVVYLDSFIAACVKNGQLFFYSSPVHNAPVGFPVFRYDPLAGRYSTCVSFLSFSAATPPLGCAEKLRTWYSRLPSYASTATYSTCHRPRPSASESGVLAGCATNSAFPISLWGLSVDTTSSLCGVHPSIDALRQQFS